MISIFENCSDPKSTPLLAAMFIDRKRVFVDLLDWAVPVVDGQYEIDEFDGECATYIVAADSAGAHAGSLRLLPTDRPHILDTLFAGLCSTGAPTGRRMSEITRLCLPPRLRAEDRLRVRNRLITAMVDHALKTGITTLTGVVTARFREEVLAMGWRADALGPASVINGAALGAFRIDLDANTPALLEANDIYAAGAGSALEFEKVTA